MGQDSRLGKSEYFSQRNNRRPSNLHLYCIRNQTKNNSAKQSSSKQHQMQNINWTVLSLETNLLPLSHVIQSHYQDFFGTLFTQSWFGLTPATVLLLLLLGCVPPPDSAGIRIKSRRSPIVGEKLKQMDAPGITADGAREVPTLNWSVGNLKTKLWNFASTGILVIYNYITWNLDHTFGLETFGPHLATFTETVPIYYLKDSFITSSITTPTKHKYDKEKFQTASQLHLRVRFPGLVCIITVINK